MIDKNIIFYVCEKINLETNNPCCEIALPYLCENLKQLERIVSRFKKNNIKYKLEIQIDQI